MSSTGNDIEIPGRPLVQEIGDGIFAYIQPDGTWWINNTGFITGQSRVAAIDACATEKRTRALLTAIESKTRAAVRTLINTHHHGDHTHGNSLFVDATIVAHERCRAEMLAEGRPGTSALIGSGTWIPWNGVTSSSPHRS